jgi:uncharacterized repeat protein (TIGR01451 family)
MLLLALALLPAVSASADVRRLALPTNDLVYDQFRGKIYASVPGRAGSIGRGVQVIDPETGSVGPGLLVGGEPGKLALSADGRSLDVALDGAGAVRRLDLPSLLPGLRFSPGPGAGVQPDGGRIFMPSGWVIDSESGQTVGRFPGLPEAPQEVTAVASDASSRRVFFLAGGSQPTRTILVYNQRDFRPIGSLEVEGVSGRANRLIRWGADGLAFSSEAGELFLIRSALVTATLDADVSVTMTALPPSVRVGEPITFRITITNRGPELATGVVLTDPLPAGVSFVSAHSTQGGYQVSRRIMLCTLGAVPVGQSVVIDLVVTPTAIGTITNGVALHADGPDPDLSNNSATQKVTVTQRLCATDVTRSVPVTRGALTYNASTRRYRMQVQLANPGRQAIPGPISLVLDGLGSVVLTNASGRTSCQAPVDSPYVQVDVGPDGVLSPKEVATVTLECDIPAGKGLKYRTRVLAGAGDR